MVTASSALRPPPLGDEAAPELRVPPDARRNSWLPLLAERLGPLDDLLKERLRRCATLRRMPRGARLYARGDETGGFHLVLGGRLHGTREGGGGTPESGALWERGDLVGAEAVFDPAPRRETMTAVRDALIVDFDRAAVELLAPRASALARIALDLRERAARAEGPVPLVLAVVDLDDTPASRSFVAALAQAAHTPLAPFALDGERPDGVHEPRAARYEGRADEAATRIEEHARRHGVAIVGLESPDGPRTDAVLGVADRVLFIGTPGRATEFARWARALPSGARLPRDVVVLHPAGTGAPSGGASFLDAMAPVARLHHVRSGRARDAERVVRLLTGRAVALVLGGGGARGLSHLGILRVLDEAGLEPDVVCGVSVGAAVAARYARGEDAGERERGIATLLAHRVFADWTLPLVSLLGDRTLARALLQSFGDQRVEDTWVPFFCFSTDLTETGLRLHDRGPLRSAIRASISVPGLLPPAVEDGRLLIDGGVTDNLPSARARACSGAHAVVAVDVGERASPAPLAPSSVARKPRWKRWLAGHTRALPTLPELLLRGFSLMSAASALAGRADADLVLRPAIDGFGMLDFGHAAAIIDAGRACALANLTALRAAFSREPTGSGRARTP